MSNWLLKRRVLREELMDDVNVDPLALNHALAHLEKINIWLNGYGPSFAGIRELCKNHQREVTLLDVGCGSGDTLRQIAAWSRKKSISVKLTGIELSETTALRASAACKQYPEIEILHENLFHMAEKRQFDIVHGALMLHHFSADSDVVNVLKTMRKHARVGVIINDLHRHSFAWGAIWLLTRIFSRSAILHNDAPLSVARSFTADELRTYAIESECENVSINWHWAFRWLMVMKCRELGNVQV